MRRIIIHTHYNYTNYSPVQIDHSDHPNTQTAGKKKSCQKKAKLHESKPVDITSLLSVSHTHEFKERIHKPFFENIG